MVAIKLLLHSFTLLILLPALCLADNASEREYIKEKDPEISQSLGIGTLQFEDCFYDVNPQGQYDKQSDLLPCLQQYNPSITNDQLNQVLEQYKPERY